MYIDLTSPLTLLLVLIATVLLIYLAQEVKKSYIAAIPLVAFLALLISHTTAMLTLGSADPATSTVLLRCIAIDFVFILITFFSYLWTDDVEAKATDKKSIDNSLDWFWKKV